MKSFSLFCFLFSSDFFFLLLFCFFLLCYQTITCEMRERKGKKLRIDTGSVCVWDSIDLLVYIFLQFLFCIFMQIVRPFVLMQRDMECVCWMIMGLATDIWEVLICRRPTHSLKQTRFVLGDFFFFLLSFKGKFFLFLAFFYVVLERNKWRNRRNVCDCGGNVKCCCYHTHTFSNWGHTTRVNQICFDWLWLSNEITFRLELHLQNITRGNGKRKLFNISTHIHTIQNTHAVYERIRHTLNQLPSNINLRFICYH